MGDGALQSYNGFVAVQGSFKPVDYNILHEVAANPFIEVEFDVGPRVDRSAAQAGTWFISGYQPWKQKG